MSEPNPKSEVPDRVPHRQPWQTPRLKLLDAADAETGFLANPELPYSTS